MTQIEPTAPTAAAADDLVRVLRYPYPYRCALTLCNDLDFLAPPEFLRIHEFLNTHRQTAYGDGLGLEIGDSFWLYSPDAEQALSYFRDATGTEQGPWAALIRDGLRAGVLDCLHSWGDFSFRGGFGRRMAEAGLEALQRHGLHASVWTNHGDRHNFQNLGEDYSLGDVREVRSANGDRFPSREYHADLVSALGIRFAWRSRDLTDVWGQDRALGATDVCAPDRMRHPRTWLHWLRLQLAAGERANTLLTDTALRDGTRLQTFKRYGRFTEDRMDDLAHVLAEPRLNELSRTGAVAIVYTHLGKRRDPSGSLIPAAVQSALRGLAARAQAGEVFVTTTARLLTYCAMRDRVQPSVAAAADAMTVDLGDIPPNEVMGLSLEVRDARPVICRAAGRDVPTVTVAGRDAGRVEMVPWKPLALSGFFEQHRSAAEAS